MKDEYDDTIAGEMERLRDAFRGAGEGFVLWIMNCINWFLRKVWKLLD